MCSQFTQFAPMLSDLPGNSILKQMLHVGASVPQLYRKTKYWTKPYQTIQNYVQTGTSARHFKLWESRSWSTTHFTDLCASKRMQATAAQYRVQLGTHHHKGTELVSSGISNMSNGTKSVRL